MGATSRKTLGAAGTQINMHKNNTQDSAITTKGWGKSTRTRVGENQLEQGLEFLATLPLDRDMDML